MKRILKLGTILLVAALVFLPSRPAAASSGGFDGKVVFGESYTLASDETLVGDLMVFGGSATIESGATVDGQVVVIGGNLVIDGEVTGDVAVTGGTVTLGETASILGDLVTVGATIDRAAGAQVGGDIYNTATSWLDGSNVEQPVVPETPQTPTLPDWTVFNLGGMLGSIRNAFGQAVGLGLLAMLLMLFLASHADRVAHAVIAQPLFAGGIGLLTIVVVPVAMVLLSVTLILIPVAALVGVALGVVIVFGWIAIGYEIGKRFTQAIHQTWHPAFSAGLGTFALSLVTSALTAIPVLKYCVGWLIPTLLGLAALGAVVMTRFGTQNVDAPVKQTAVTPVNPPQG